MAEKLKGLVGNLQVTTMVLKVDLGCEKCYKKVKKVLCKFPQIRDQVYDEKQGTVTIKVFCCCPEKIRDKLCSKGGGSIRSIEIKEAEKAKPAEAEKKKEAEKPKAEAEKKKEAEKPKAEAEKKKEAEKPKAEAEKKKEAEKPKGDGGEKKKEAEKPKGDGGEKKKEAEKPKADGGEKKKEGDKPKTAEAVPGYPPQQAYPFSAACVPFYDGQPGAPCFHGYGGAPVYSGTPVVIYDGYYGRPVYDSYGGGGRLYSGYRCDQYFTDENSTGCTVM